MRLVKWLALAAVITILVGGATQALAQASLDTPTGAVGLTSRVGVFIDVQAGPSGAPAGFTVEWMKKSDYDRLGGWPTSPDPAVWYCSFIGIPTSNPSTGSFLLGPGGSVEVEMGDLFDETGVEGNGLAELPSGEDLVFRLHAEAGAGLGESSFSPTLFAATTAIPQENCTFTQGYWKTHPDAWPVSALTLGTVTYTKNQLLDILNTPAGGNGLLILAHQLIAAKLNIANGADPTLVASTIAAADALIDGLVIPPVGSGFLAPSAVNALKDVLDEYNNGSLGTPHCGTVAAQPTTWGGLKGFYR